VAGLRSAIPIAFDPWNSPQKIRFENFNLPELFKGNLKVGDLELSVWPSAEADG
jgi:hypothetical protein